MTSSLRVLLRGVSFIGIIFIAGCDLAVDPETLDASGSGEASDSSGENQKDKTTEGNQVNKSPAPAALTCKYTIESDTFAPIVNSISAFNSTLELDYAVDKAGNLFLGEKSAWSPNGVGARILGHSVHRKLKGSATITRLRGVASDSKMENVKHLLKWDAAGNLYSAGAYYKFAEGGTPAYETIHVVKYPKETLTTGVGWTTLTSHEGFSGASPAQATGDFDLFFDPNGVPHLIADYKDTASGKYKYNIQKLDFENKKVTSLVKYQSLRDTPWFIQGAFQIDPSNIYVPVNENGALSNWVPFFEISSGTIKGSAGIGSGAMQSGPGVAYKFLESAFDKSGRLMMLLGVTLPGASGTMKTWRVSAQKTKDTQFMRQETVPMPLTIDFAEGTPTNMVLVGDDIFVGVNAPTFSGTVYKVLHLPAASRDKNEWQVAYTFKGPGAQIAAAEGGVAVFGALKSELAPSAPAAGVTGSWTYKTIKSWSCGN